MGFEMMAAGVAYHLCFLLLVTQVQGSNFDVKAYGAKANGMTDDSKVQDENFCAPSVLNFVLNIFSKFSLPKVLCCCRL
jgi:hypothetical protein